MIHLTELKVVLMFAIILFFFNVLLQLLYELLLLSDLRETKKKVTIIHLVENCDPRGDARQRVLPLFFDSLSSFHTS